MKNLFIALTATLLLPTSVAAQNLVTKPAFTKYESTVGTRAEQALVYGYCREMATNVGVQQANVKIGGAIEIPVAVSQLWGESNITGLKVAIGNNGNSDATVFVTENLGGAAIYTQNVKLMEGWTEITFNEAVKVPSKDFYVGYEITTKTANDFPLAVDAVASSNPYSGFIGLNGSWQNYASQYGAVGVKAIITGENLPANDVTLLNPPVLSDYIPFDTPFSVGAYVVNNGSSTIENMTVDASVNGTAIESPTVTFSQKSIAPGETALVTIGNLVSLTKGSNIPVEIKVSQVNGQQDANPSDNIINGKSTCITQVFPKMFVVEEWTGTWCGYCPFGIVGMDYMAHTYGKDRFIGIAVHGGSGNEPMITTSYNTFLNKYGRSFPGCIINRDGSLQTQPSLEVLEYYYNSMADLETFAGVTIEDIAYTTGDKEITVKAGASFSLNKPNSKYRLAFVLTEDQVGPYYQTNYYAGGSQGAMGGWETKQGSVEWYYDEVARFINTCLGIEGSLPTDIVDGEKYEYTATLPTSNIQNIDNCYVTVLLLDGRTGIIENAVKTKVIGGETGVSTITDETAPCAVYPVAGGIAIKGDYSVCRVYDLTGKKVAEQRGNQTIAVPEGLYVVAVESAGKIYQSKIMVK